MRTRLTYSFSKLCYAIQLSKYNENIQNQDQKSTAIKNHCSVFHNKLIKRINKHQQKSINRHVQTISPSSDCITAQDIFVTKPTQNVPDRQSLWNIISNISKQFKQFFGIAKHNNYALMIANIQEYYNQAAEKTVEVIYYGMFLRNTKLSFMKDRYGNMTITTAKSGFFRTTYKVMGQQTVSQEIFEKTFNIQDNKITKEKIQNKIDGLIAQAAQNQSLNKEHALNTSGYIGNILHQITTIIPSQNVIENLVDNIVQSTGFSKFNSQSPSTINSTCTDEYIIDLIIDHAISVLITFHDSIDKSTSFPMTVQKIKHNRKNFIAIATKSHSFLSTIAEEFSLAITIDTSRNKRIEEYQKQKQIEEYPNKIINQNDSTNNNAA